MTSEWDDACDPVPARRELTDAQRRRLKAYFELRIRQGFRKKAIDVPSVYRVDSDFDDMGA